MKEDKKIVMLISHCFSSNVLYNYLSNYHTIDKVIVEEPLRGMALARRRIKKLGVLKVSGQIFFSVIIVPLLRNLGKRRIKEIRQNYKLKDKPIPEDNCIYFPTVNDHECIRELNRLKPDVVIVNGTRIISKKVLDAVDATFINMHAGITPRYRGVHGGYWALYNKDPEHCGVTVHLVDKGIDTGNVLYQKIIEVSPADNFATYPDIQLAEGLPLMRQAVDDVINGTISLNKNPDTTSSLWFHPGFWQYCFNRIFRGVK